MEQQLFIQDVFHLKINMFSNKMVFFYNSCRNWTVCPSQSSLRLCSKSNHLVCLVNLSLLALLPRPQFLHLQKICQHVPALLVLQRHEAPLHPPSTSAPLQALASGSRTAALAVPLVEVRWRRRRCRDTSGIRTSRPSTGVVTKYRWWYDLEVLSPCGKSLLSQFFLVN